jgi:hypothetical protein
MLDQSQFDEQQNQIISRMLQRTTLYKEDSSEEEPETEDWVCYYICYCFIFKLIFFIEIK